MGRAVELRQDYDGDILRRLARQSSDGDQTRRLLALAAIYDGGRRTEAARIGAVTLQIVRDSSGDPRGEIPTSAVNVGHQEKHIAEVVSVHNDHRLAMTRRSQ